MAPIKWRAEQRTFDSYEKHYAWLCGALAAKNPSCGLRMPLHPLLREEWDNGAWCYRNGYLKIPDDFDPAEATGRLKINRKLKQSELLARAGG